MQLMCPECRSPLEAISQTEVRCHAHGADYDVLFLRPAAPPAARPTPVAAPPPIPVATAEHAPDMAIPLGHAATGHNHNLVAECPSCGHKYSAPRSTIGQNAKCKCGSSFRVEDPDSPGIFAISSAEPEGANSTTCVQHPDMDAAFSCVRCHALMCQTCAFPQADGSVLCPRCAGSGAPSAGQGPNAFAATAPAMSLADGSVCVTHPTVPATRRCARCRSAVCATCDFSLPGDVHLCPTCAVDPQTRLSGKRKTLAISSVVLATLATVSTALLMTGAIFGEVTTEAEDEILGMLFIYLVVMPALIGVALGAASFERQLKTPAIVWLGTIWNGLILGAALLLIVIGILIG